MNKYPISKCKIRFNDCDMFGHLNNARYIDYLINARQDHLKDEYNFDYGRYYKNNLGWVIGSHEIVYLKPTVFDEIVSIQSCLLNVDNNSLFVEVIMMNENRTQIKAILRSKLILVNIKEAKREQHSPEFLDWAKSLVIDEAEALPNMQDRIKYLLLELRKTKNI